MSRARREQRDLLRRGSGLAPVQANKEIIVGSENGENINGVQKPVEKEYTFFLETTEGRGSFKVPASQMKSCPCGCDKVRLSFRLCFVKPTGRVGVKPIVCRDDVYVCEACGEVVGDWSPTVAQVAAKREAERQEAESKKIVVDVLE
jgi:hypothetical protein